MVCVDRVGLLLVEARGVRVHIGDVERRDHLVAGEHVAIGRERPAQQRKVVEQPLGNEAAIAVVQQVRLGVALRKLLVTLTHDVRQVAKARDRLLNAELDEGAVQRNLARGRREQVFATQHVGDSHERIVDRVRQRVERCSVRAHHHEVDCAAGGKVDLAAHEVVEAEVDLGNPEPQRGLAALGAERGLLLVGQVAVVVVVAELLRAPRSLVAGIDLFCGRVALVEVAGSEQAIRDLAIDLAALRLAVRLVRAADVDALVPVEAKPAQ